ncbi:MAG TPA: M14 family zinc carboxypeptidase [Bacteroidales bacterium]|nr:M14 family zinc carboxypeptidase [Bacteroidales bacterium]
MLKRLPILIFSLFVTLGSLWAQQVNVNELFGKRGEIYFKFEKSDADLQRLSSQISIDAVRGDDVFAYANKEEFADFLKSELSFEVLPKPGELIKNPRMLHDVNIKAIDDWDFYPTYEAYISMMNQYAIEYPDLCQVFSIGQTTQGRQLMVAKISDNVGTREAEPQFLYTGTMHGDETAGYIILLRMIDYLLENYATNPEIAALVNNSEIWINPAANPDGTYAGGNNTVYGSTRYNANNVDLNRNYPDPKDGPHPDGKAWQPETIAFMQMAEENNFVMSANTHGGSEVINYPWDTWSRLHADDDWLYFVSREYADTVHVYAPTGYLTALNNGVTNGYQWYSITGSRQDYMTYFQQCRELTMELSNTKLLSPSQLPAHWNYNYRSMLNYMRQATYGVNGTVTDMVTGDPLAAMISIENHDADSSMVFTSPVTGFYQRPIEAGSYNFTFSAPGHFPQTINNVQVSRYATVNLNVQLDAGTLIPDFSASATSVSMGSTVNFTDLSYGNPVSWSWTFEGGQPATSTVKNPQNVLYSQIGNFDVSLTVTDAGGNSETIVKENYISVNAEFLMGNQTITTCTGLFYDSGGSSGNYGNNEDYTMTFKPETAGSNIIVDFLEFSVEPNSSCSYDWLKIYNGISSSAPLIGTYCGTTSPGTIEASNAEGALTFVFHSDYSVNKPGWKAVISCSELPLLPIADFTADNTHIWLGQSVQFTDMSANNPTSWSWTFEGGTPATSIAQDPLVTYNSPGYYDVTLVVVNAYGTDTKTIENYIFVEELLLPVADFVADSTHTWPGHTVQFTDLTINNPTSWNWTFEGGTPATSSVQNPLITYNSPGYYDVTLVVENAYGTDTKTIVDYIFVEELLLPIADFTADSTHIWPGHSVQFTDLTINNPIAWNWTFEGGSPGTSTAQHPLITYLVSGYYDVTLVVENVNGTDTRTIQNFIFVDSSIGFAEYKKSVIKVYPNPANDLINIRADVPIVATELTDLSGRSISFHTLSADNTQLQVGSIQNGIYLLKIYTADTCYTRRVMLMH